MADASPHGIVCAQYMLAPRYTFAHEVGHWLKARHNRVSNGGTVEDNSGECNYGFRELIFTNVYQYSIMAFLPPNEGSRSLMFSNARYFGDDYNANAEYISTTFCGLSDLVYADDELGISIAGNQQLCEDPVTYTISIDAAGLDVPGQAPYTYKWRLGNGIFTDNPYATIQSYGNTNSITLDPLVHLPQNSQADFYLYASISSSDGVFVNHVQQLKRICFPEKPAETTSVSKTNNINHQISVYPNPTSSELFFISNNINGIANYSIYAIEGQLLLSGKLIFVENKTNSIQLNLPTGYYTICLESNEFYSTIPFIVEK